MSAALWLLALQGALGAFDTAYYHEWRARLVARVPGTRSELRLHGARDLVYALIFASLPQLEWRGLWAALLVGLLLVEIAITLADFAIEDRVRRALGGVYPGERVTHALMGIVYGAFLACLTPALADWAEQPTALAAAEPSVPAALRALLALMALGVAVSGARDLAAAAGVRGAAWPWTAERD